MINGLDLFSGIGGITIALAPWVKPIAYCENDRYATSVLLDRMADGQIPIAPIWDDVTTLRGCDLPQVDMVYGGFPCQDISVAGAGKGLEGKRSGLFFEIMRLVDEVQPTWIFLENVPAITTRGLGVVTAEITKRGYDCRWTTLSAAEVGANHKRNRWFLLAYSPSARLQERSGKACWQGWQTDESKRFSCEIPHTNSKRLEGQRQIASRTSEEQQNPFSSCWWATEPDVGRVVNGLPARVDRIKCLGNAVVPLQAREAFKELMGL